MGLASKLVAYAGFTDCQASKPMDRSQSCCCPACTCFWRPRLHWRQVIMQACQPKSRLARSRRAAGWVDTYRPCGVPKRPSQPLQVRHIHRTSCWSFLDEQQPDSLHFSRVHVKGSSHGRMRTQQLSSVLKIRMSRCQSSAMP